MTEQPSTATADGEAAPLADGTQATASPEDGDGTSEPAESATADGSARIKALEHEGDVAADFLEELLDIADLDGDIDLDVEGDRAMVAIVGDGLGHLAGPDGKVLDALQDLTRLAVHQETGERSRLILDVAGYRAARRERLSALGRDAAEKVQASGEPLALEPMTAFERKVVHDAVAAAGLTSSSDGVEPNRYVVVAPRT